MTLIKITLKVIFDEGENVWVAVLHAAAQNHGHSRMIYLSLTYLNVPFMILLGKNHWEKKKKKVQPLFNPNHLTSRSCIRFDVFNTGLY